MLINLDDNNRLTDFQGRKINYILLKSVVVVEFVDESEIKFNFGDLIGKSWNSMRQKQRTIIYFKISRRVYIICCEHFLGISSNGIVSHNLLLHIMTNWSVPAGAIEKKKKRNLDFSMTQTVYENQVLLSFTLHRIVEKTLFALWRTISLRRKSEGPQNLIFVRRLCIRAVRKE